MKRILAINTANSGGGAEKVAYDLCRELYCRGFDVKLMARRIDYEADPLARQIVIRVPGRDSLYSAGNFIDQILSTQYLFYAPTWRIPFMECVTNADVIHFHNLHGYYFNMLTVPFLARRRPVVWTLHDMWPFTGKCVHAFGCERYTQHCGRCPQLDAYPRLSRDTTRFHLALKKLFFSRPRLTLVSPSEWLRVHLGRSILRNQQIFVVPSPVDTSVFRPASKEHARELLGIPQGKKVLLFVASWINSIPSKGIAIFKEMLQALYSTRQDLFTIVVGHLENKPVLTDALAGIETGWIGDRAAMSACYTAADLFVAPTLAENSSCTIVESMACGTVPVAFAVGGVPEQIIDGETGILVPPSDVRGLISAVSNLLDHETDRLRIGACAAEHAKSRYSMESFVSRYTDIYRAAIRLKSSGTMN